MTEKNILPKVTLMTLVFNNADRVIPALDSIQLQTFQDFDHVIIDDGSRPEHLELTRQWLESCERPVTYIKHAQNKGVNRSLNEIFSLAKGEYIFGVSDDFADKDFLEIMVPYLETNADAAVVYSDCRIIAPDKSILAPSYFALHTQSPHLMGPKFTKALLNKNFIPACTCLMRKSAIINSGGYDETLLYEDWDIWLRLSERYRFIRVPEIKSSYLKVSGGLSNQLSTLRFDTSTAKLLGKYAGRGLSAQLLTLKHILKMCIRHANKSGAIAEIQQAYCQSSRSLLSKTFFLVMKSWAVRRFAPIVLKLAK